MELTVYYSDDKIPRDKLLENTIVFICEIRNLKKEFLPNFYEFLVSEVDSPLGNSIIINYMEKSLINFAITKLRKVADLDLELCVKCYALMVLISSTRSIDFRKFKLPSDAYHIDVSVLTSVIRDDNLASIKNINTSLKTISKHRVNISSTFFTSVRSNSLFILLLSQFNQMVNVLNSSSLAETRDIRNSIVQGFKEPRVAYLLWILYSRSSDSFLELMLPMDNDPLSLIFVDLFSMNTVVSDISIKVTRDGYLMDKHLSNLKSEVKSKNTYIPNERKYCDDILDSNSDKVVELSSNNAWEGIKESIIENPVTYKEMLSSLDGKKILIIKSNDISIDFISDFFTIKSIYKINKNDFRGKFTHIVLISVGISHSDSYRIDKYRKGKSVKLIRTSSINSRRIVEDIYSQLN